MNGISHLKEQLSLWFEMKNLGEDGCFLGVEVGRSEKGYFISHKGYVKNLLQRLDICEDNGYSYGAGIYAEER